MAVGDWHQLGETRFRETLHGPMIATRCVVCGTATLVVQDHGRINAHGLREDVCKTPMCSGCLRRKHELT
jgi:hypothetical protein